MAWTRGEQRNPAEPEEGHYAVKLVKKGPEVGAWIVRTSNCFSELTVEDGRQPLWYALVNGEAVGAMCEDPELHDEVQKIWLFGRKIDKQEYDYLVARYKSYSANWPDHPYANPEKPIDDTARRMMGPLED
jgi:hypothetical protein